jgi:serine/threonine-protein kinase
MTQGAPDADLVPGRLIAGRFRLERQLGKGGMGAVWLAHHLNLNVEVALKFIDASVAQREDVASRFAQEAQAAAKVKSPHVVNILDYGTDAFGRAYIAMELLHGEELAQRLARWGRLPLADVCRVVVHACRGLGRAHSAGVVHRDLKPENLFLVDDEEGFVTKILDFGIAKASTPVGPITHQTGTGLILGTPFYLSPEQALGRGDVDFRSDLYSLAVVAYRCLTGELPFTSEALGELIVKISTEPVPSATARRPDLPAAIDAWFQRALHKDPAKRFASAREMAETFLQASGLSSGAYAGSVPPPASLRTHVGARPSDGGAPARGLETLMGATANSTPPARRSWLGYGAAAALVGLLLSAGYFLGPWAQGRGAGVGRDRSQPAAPSVPPGRPPTAPSGPASAGAAPKASGTTPSKPDVAPHETSPHEPPRATNADAHDDASAEGAHRRRPGRAAPAAPVPPKGKAAASPPDAPPPPASAAPPPSPTPAPSSTNWGID